MTSIDQTVKTYEERVAGRYTFSMSYSDCEQESELRCINSNFYYLNKSDAHVFSCNERDDKKGFNIDIRGVIVVPNTFICVGDAPKWLQWLIRRVCKTVVERKHYETPRPPEST